jgi:hypothetical protein
MSSPRRLPPEHPVRRLDRKRSAATQQHRYRQLEIKDYNASLGAGGVSLTRNYTAQVSTDGTEWNVDQILVFDPNNPLAEPREAPIDEDSEPNQAKLDELKNALDDLRIVDVARKPEGMSANLKAEKELVSDNEAIASLAQRGFLPLELGPEGETEIISANGELSVILHDGVRYILRFGNVSGLADDDDPSAETETAAGVNRYLLVTTEVDESRFPPPDLQPVPQTLEELEQLLRSDQPPPQTPDTDAPSNESPAEPMPESAPREEGNVEPAAPAGNSGDQRSPGDEGEPAEPQDPAPEEPPPADETDEPVDEPVAGVIRSSGRGEATGSGQGQEPSSGDEPATDEPATDEPPTDEPAPEEPRDQPVTEERTNEDRASEDSPDESSPVDPPADEPDREPMPPDDDVAPAESSPDADPEPDAEMEPDARETDDAEPMEPAPAVSELEGLSEEEQLERLEAEQEKITKENQRLLDERNDQIEAARRRVRELNARFADWYYVIPEATYQQLRIRRSELFAAPSEEGAEADASPPVEFPNFNAPAPGGFDAPAPGR